MTRYFFDYERGAQSVHDFKGREFGSEHEARELAILIALDLQYIEDGEWDGWTVLVRDTHGRRLYGIEVSNDQMGHWEGFPAEGEAAERVTRPRSSPCAAGERLPAVHAA
jgi:hypothetical protein